MELKCPSCFYMIEISDAVLLTRKRARCKKCGQPFLVLSYKPFVACVQTSDVELEKPRAPAPTS